MRNWKKTDVGSICVWLLSDQKFSIHYFCEEWTDELMRLLKKSGNEALYAEVKNYCKAMTN